MVPSITRRQASLAVALLFGVNFLNYIDRYVIAAVAPHLQADLHLTHTQLGWAMGMFTVAYTLASPFTGVIGDRYPRRYLIGAGVLVWSVATVASGLASSYGHLLLARSFIGAGEAGFGTVAPTIISDLYPKERRGAMLAFFYVAIPVGSALGFILGGWMGEHYGWRSAFFVAGLPGIVLGSLAFFMKEPMRGAADGVTRSQPKFDPAALLDVARSRTFVLTTLGISAMAFALGGMANWMPTFFTDVKGMPLAKANSVFGGMTVVSGLVGTFLGGWLGDRLQRYTDRAYLLVSGVGMLLAVPLTYVGITAESPSVYLPAWFAAEVLVFLNTGPANAVLLNVAMPEVRATAIAASVFVYHLLGDASSPALIGWAADRTGSLGLALQLTTLAMGVSGVLYMLASKTLGADSERVLRKVAEREACAAS